MQNDYDLPNAFFLPDTALEIVGPTAVEFGDPDERKAWAIRQLTDFDHDPADRPRFAALAGRLYSLGVLGLATLNMVQGMDEIAPRSQFAALLAKVRAALQRLDPSVVIGWADQLATEDERPPMQFSAADDANAPGPRGPLVGNQAAAMAREQLRRTGTKAKASSPAGSSMAARQLAATGRRRGGR